MTHAHEVDSPPPEPSTHLVNLVYILAAALRREGDALTQEYGLSTSRWLIAGALADGPQPAATIARKRGLTRQSVRESAARLERDGLIRRAPNPHDARAPLLVLTPLGSNALALIEPARRRWAQRTDAILSEREWQSTLRSLDRLVARLSDQAPSTTEDRTDP